MSYSILFVDDEQRVLSSLKRMFLDEDYELFFALSGKEGLDILQNQPIHLVISDMRMPEMDGVQFLSKVKETYPETVRIVLSGYADMDSIREAINKGGIWRYITKPWDDYEMKLTIKNALELYKSNKDRLELLDQLRKRNEELVNLNERLEEKVSERTALLDGQNTILKMILEDTDINELLKYSTTIIQNLIAPDSSVFIYTDINQSTVSCGDHLDEALLLKFIEDSKLKKESYIENGAYIFPLTKLDNYLGTLVILKYNDIERCELIGSNFTSLISMSLMQNKSYLEAPRLLSNINSIIENM